MHEVFWDYGEYERREFALEDLQAVLDAILVECEVKADGMLRELTHGTVVPGS